MTRWNQCRHTITHCSTWNKPYFPLFENHQIASCCSDKTLREIRSEALWSNGEQCRVTGKQDRWLRQPSRSYAELPSVLCVNLDGTHGDRVSRLLKLRTSN